MNRPDRTPLSRDRIVEAAVELADGQGLTALTMRRLGQVLDVEAMSLYHHVNGREDLLEGMVASLVDGVRLPSRLPLGPADGWQAFLQHTAHDIRRVAIEHPLLFPLDAYPTLLRLSAGLRAHDASGDFERALEALLDRLDGDLSS